MQPPTVLWNPTGNKIGMAKGVHMRQCAKQRLQIVSAEVICIVLTKTDKIFLLPLPTSVPKTLFLCAYSVRIESQAG